MAPPRTRHIEDPAKRGSDSLLDAKIKDHISQQPRNTPQNRAQSLDLSISLSRITESGNAHAQIESPTHSVNGDESDPASATAPSFPSVYGPPGSATRSAVIGHPNERSDFDEDTADEVARVISNLGL